MGGNGARASTRVSNELVGLVPGTETLEEIKVESRTVATMKKKKAKGETIEFSEPLGEYRKQKLISAIQAQFSDAATETGVMVWIDAPESVARLSNCQS